MKTRVVQVGDDPEQDAGVIEAAGILRRGGLVAFPTETVYGLGADATSVRAVEAVYAVKKRPLDNPLIVHIADLEQLEEVSRPPDGRARLLAGAFWPGPLTLVLPARDPVRRAVCRERETVAVRMPAHPVALALIRRTARPLAAPSANLSGRPSPTSAAHVLDDLAGRIPLILDGGPCRVGIESTVLDLSEGAAAILRPGGVTPSMLQQALGQPVLTAPQPQDVPRSPGLRHRHYQPRAPLYLIDKDVSDQALNRFLDSEVRCGRFGYLGGRPAIRRRRDAACLQEREGEADQARHLYADLRELDRLGVAFILAELPLQGELGNSLLDRLHRASSEVLAEEEGEARLASGSADSG